MPALLQSVPPVDREPFAAGMASSAAILIFDLFAVGKSKARGSSRFLQRRMHGNQNPVSSGRGQTAHCGSDINQSFFIIRTRGKPRFFAIGNQRNQNYGRRLQRAAFDFELFPDIKNSAEILGFLQKEIKQIKQIKRPETETTTASRAEGELDFIKFFENQVSAETLGFIQVGNQEIKFDG